MKGYWAEITHDRITFYMDRYLERLGIFSGLLEKRAKYWLYMQRVHLSADKVKKLEAYGIEVLKTDFFALEGKWHWFTGYSHTDAFRLTPAAMRIINEQGSLMIKFKDEKEQRISVVSPSEFKAEYLLERIKNKFKDVIIHSKIVEGKNAEYSRHDLPLTNELIASLKRQKIKLYKHQADAIKYALEGRNVVISTPTASGKTICFNVPVLDSIIRDRNSCALYVYPTKALAQDQIRKIAKFSDDYQSGITEKRYNSGYYFTMKLGGREIAFGKYEGPTPQDIRRKIRETCNIVLTNPDELHFGILCYNPLWARFLKNLKYVVLDEVHVYKGIFGSHMALIVRRLRKICEAFGSKPTFILCSATIGNPLEHARNLTGYADFVLIDEDSSPRKKKILALWNPPLRNAGKRVEALTNVIDLLTEVLVNPSQIIKTIVFGRSRLSVKLAYKLVEQRFEQQGLEGLAKFIREYTATLPPEKREKIFAELASGEVHAIIGTNALELGVDIPEMSCYLSIGYPGSITSVQQQFGRVGRSGEGLGIVVLHDDPLEQYFARNPDEFFNKKPEDVRINPSNPELLKVHLTCCIQEMSMHGGLKDEDIKRYFDEEADECKKKLADEKKILRYEKDHKTYWKFNYAKFDIRKEYLPIRNPLSSINFAIICNGEEIGIIDYASVLRDLHPGAIWIDNDKQYEVINVDFKNRLVEVREVDFEYYTVAAPKDTVYIIQEKQQKSLRKFRASFGLINVKREVTEYWKIIPGKDTAELKRINWGSSIPLEICSFNTDAFWLTLPIQYKTVHKDQLEGALHAIEHSILSIMPKWVNCDPNDVKGAYNLDCPENNGNPTIFIFDNYSGGVGLAKACFEKIHDILQDCIKLIETCKCTEETGCPACIQISRCEKRNQKLNKRLALKILKQSI